MDYFAIMISKVIGKRDFIHISFATFGPGANKVFGPSWRFEFLTSVDVGHLSSFV